MANKRFIPRQRRRLPLTLGEGRAAFTADVSPGGFAVELMQVVRPGTTVTGSLQLGDAQFPFTGTVSWARAGDPRMSVRGRMGVRFTGIANAFYERFLTL